MLSVNYPLMLRPAANTGDLMIISVSALTLSELAGFYLLNF
jgi:hypothetical protein